MTLHSNPGAPELYQVSDLRQMDLSAADGRVGSIEEIFVDDLDWQVRYLLVDDAEWISRSEKLLVPTLAVDEVEDQQQTIWAQLTRDQIANSPSLPVDEPVSRQYETEFYRYYRWPHYWQQYPRGMSDKPDTQADKTLVNAAELQRYEVFCEDELLGHVSGLVIDVSDWRLRYIEVTGNGSPECVWLIRPDWIAEVSRSSRSMRLNVPLAKMETAPPYNPGRPIDAEYEQRLLQHYGERGLIRQ